jgi:hypothetical protein
MTTPPRPPAALDAALDAALIAAARTYFDSRRARADDFARATFGWHGTRVLHRAALGWDLLRAPVNILLALAFVIQRLLALLLGLVRLHRAAAWLRDHPLLLRTAVAADVERRILADFLDLTAPGATGQDALAAAVLASPRMRELIRARASVPAATTLARDVARSVEDYAGSRAAVADMTTALGTLGAGALAFQTLTPGMISVAPALAGVIAHQTAIAAFPLGGAIGGLWYGLFPPQATLALSFLALSGLLILAALVSAFAGLIADPVQIALGIHQRRLLRLVDALEAAFTGTTDAGFAAREHYLARLLDVADAGLAATRHLRG